MNPHIFREYDIRGIAETDLNDEAVATLGRAMATHYRAHGAVSVAVGRDVRLTSPRIQTALVKGMLPTPLLYHATAVGSLDGGIMVTGSHNPIEYNGLKLVRAGAPVYGDEIKEIGRVAQVGSFSDGSGTVTEVEAYGPYRAEVEPILAPKRGLRIVIDSGNGAAALIAVELFRALGHEVEPLYCEPDGRFPNHLPDPTVPKYMTDLIARVEATDAELGIGFDGDADRIGVVDRRGRIVWGDQILALLARDLLERQPGASVLFDVKCSQALAEDITAHGGKPVMGATGHSLIKAKMKAEGIPLAGEMSGHMFLAEQYRGFDDALFAAGRLLQALARWGRGLDELVDGLPQYESTPEIRVECPDDVKFDVVAQMVRQFEQDYDVSRVDGARVQFGDGWGLLRASNTQPVLVMRFEAKTSERLAEIRSTFENALKSFPEVHLESGDA